MSRAASTGGAARFSDKSRHPPKGAKTELVAAAIRRFAGRFRVSDIQRECPGVSVDLIRRVLKNLRSLGRVKCLGRGQSAEWQRTAKWK